MELDYKTDIEIDEAALDIEWLNQPKLAMRYGEYLSKCKDRVLRAEESLKLIKAELNVKANEDPDLYLGQGVKPTGPNVEAYVRANKKHIAAKNEFMDASRDVTIADIAYQQISRVRKEALENLVKLHAAHYFAGPSVPRELSYEVAQKQVQERSDSQVLRRLKRK